MEVQHDPSILFSQPQIKGLRGFSLPELLVTVGVLSVLIGLMLPGFGQARRSARELTGLSGIRQLGTVVSMYMDASKAAPAVFPRRFAPENPGYHAVETPWGTVRGWWFSNAKVWQFALDERLPNEVLASPLNPALLTETHVVSDYSLSSVFYARHDYWDRRTQQGPGQWATMRLDQVTFPSSKGFMLEDMTYTHPGYPEGMMTCCATDVESRVLWADLSTSTEVQGLMPPGEPNFYHEGNPGTTVYWHDGAPIRATKHGVLGRDR